MLKGTGRASAVYVPWWACVIHQSISDRVIFELRFEGGNQMPSVNNLQKRSPGKRMNKWKSCHVCIGMAGGQCDLSKLSKEERSREGGREKQWLGGCWDWQRLKGRTLEELEGLDSFPGEEREGCSCALTGGCWHREAVGRLTRSGAS